MQYHERADDERFEDVILQSIRHILFCQDPDRFLGWALESLPAALNLDEQDLDPAEARRLTMLLARAIWDATPLPSLGFRIRPMAEPAPDDPCPCGSGHAYRRCCERIDDAPELPPDLTWELILEELGERQLQQALASGMVPAHLLGMAAERWLEQDRPGRAVGLLEPLFAKDARQTLDERFDQALNVLCDAYDRLDHWKKKREFLQRMTRNSCRALRGAAWQRLSTIHIDEGDYLEAQVAFIQAQREGPDNLGTALLEITLLAAQHEDDLARNRAVFWRHKLRRAGLQDGDVLRFLEHAAEDPQDALITSQSAILDPLLLILRETVRAVGERPLPGYALEACADIALPGHRDQLSLFEEDDAAREPVPGWIPSQITRLSSPTALHRMESSWRAVFNAPKPSSTRLTPLISGDLWERDDWVTFLAEHPAAADSLDILDDLATALYIHPESTLPWIARSLLIPLLERAEKILLRILPPDSAWIIPWPLAENQPALRLLFRLYLYRMETGAESAAAQSLRTLLRLNPGDNHGVRGDLMNHYLRQRENQEALDLAGRFPEDVLADLAFGEVLALYREGEHPRAENALGRALARLPRIPYFLTRKRVRQPDIAQSGIAGGGDDQAWLYREAMRDVWEAEPGALAWLKRHAG